MESISAISTASGRGGVAIVRISGDNALDIALKMFSLPKGVKTPSPNYMYVGNILGDGFTDYGFMVYFKAPKSFTGEDIVEFHCHGGVQIARGILNKTLASGARSAEKGEFTRRAFLNGKLTLASAEGMADMINAESLALIRAGSMLYNERLSNEVKQIQSSLKDILARIAVEIDYPEEDEEGLDFGKICADLQTLYAELGELCAGYKSGRKIKEGVTVAICGKPNTGKSSLLNAILGYDRAIVSSEAGTTRDIVEGSVELDGVKYEFIDTAGIREGAGAVEAMGIERAKNTVMGADIILSVTDGECVEIPAGASGEVIRVFNKCDILKPYGDYDIAVSAVTGEGVDKLKSLVAEKAVGELSYEKAFVIERRHADALARAMASVKEGKENIGSCTLDLISLDLREAWDALGEITGETASEEIVNTVFDKFCVGK